MNFFSDFQARAQQAVSAARDLASTVGAEALDTAQNFAATVSADARNIAADAKQRAARSQTGAEVWPAPSASQCLVHCTQTLACQEDTGWQVSWASERYSHAPFAIAMPMCAIVQQQ